MEYQIAKGVFDILPEEPDNEGKWRESSLWNFVENQAKKTAEDFGFKEIRTPIFERTELFTRSIGEGTDIISKEMYTFEDKAGRSLSLRPEGTACVMRSFIEKNLYERTVSHKYFYLFSMFRYERQQAGRYRQHHQFGVEAIGSGSPLQDVEIIDLLMTFLQRLQIKNMQLKINSIGNPGCRQKFKNAFKEYLSTYISELSEESKVRFEINPLRILDSKSLSDQKVLEKAPSILEFLDQESKDHFGSVLAELEDLNIPYIVDHKLVRGLDYYNKTVFEVTSSVLGAQNSLGGGGRYDGLLKKMGGPDLPSSGFGAGIERIIQTMLAQEVSLPKSPRPELFFIALGERSLKFCFKLVSDLRKEGISVEIDLCGKKLKNAMRIANDLQSQFVVIIGDDELESKIVSIKEMATGETKKIPIENLFQWRNHQKNI